jgi:predicted glycosyltransferase
MKIIIDIGHPAHVHYFRNFYSIMKARGNDFLIIARDKEVSHQLLNEYNIPFVTRGKGKKSIIGKLLYIFYADRLLIRYARKFKPDFFIGFASTYAAHAAKYLNKPCFIFDDTEHAKFELFLYRPFTTCIFTSFCFKKELGKKQIRFDACMELFYLHPNYFSPDKNILKELNLYEGDKYVILRFISWDASHDLGHTGINHSFKRKLIFELSKYAKVFISSEIELSEEFKPFQLKISPNKLHDILAFSSLYVGEGGTTANECACLGVPNILVNSLLNSKTIPGIHLELEKYGLQILFEKTNDKIIEIACNILNDNESKVKFIRNKDIMLNEKIDVTAFLIWFIENYPESEKIIKVNPVYQYNFK